MKYIYLSTEFYERYPQSEFPEIERKTNRPYSMIEIKIDNHTFAIPLRSSVKHKWKYPLVSKPDSGLDFKKAIYIYDSKFISDSVPRIRQKDFNLLKNKDKIIEKKFMLYLKEYVEAIESLDPHLQGATRYSTLSYFSTEINYRELVNKYFNLVISLKK